MSLKHIDRFDDSRRWLHMLTSAVDEGDDSALPMVLGQLALLECWAGSYELALSYAERGRTSRASRHQAARAGFCTCPHAGTPRADCGGSGAR